MNSAILCLTASYLLGVGGLVLSFSDNVFDSVLNSSPKGRRVCSAKRGFIYPEWVPSFNPLQLLFLH